MSIAELSLCSIFTNPSLMGADKLRQSLVASAAGTLVAHAYAFNGRRGYQRQ